MAKKTFSLFAILILFSIYSFTAFSQYICHYCSQCVSNGLCKDQNFATCAEAEASGKLACPGGGWWVESKRNDCGSKDGSWSKSPVANGIKGALLGGLIGSLFKDLNGKVLWDLGVTGGFASLSIITTIAVPKGRTFGEGFLLGALNGATLCYAVDRAKIIISDKQDAPKPPNEVTKETLISAGAGFVTGGLIGGFSARSSKGNSTSRFIRKSKLLSNSAITFSGNKMGIIIRL